MNASVMNGNFNGYAGFDKEEKYMDMIKTERYRASRIEKPPLSGSLSHINLPFLIHTDHRRRQMLSQTVGDNLWAILPIICRQAVRSSQINSYYHALASFAVFPLTSAFSAAL